MKKTLPFLIVAGVAAVLAMVSSLVSQETTNASALPSPWQFHGIGQTEADGQARTNAEVIELLGGRDQVRSTEDVTHFAHQGWRGDGIFMARVLDSGGTNNKAAAGLMVRESLAPGAPNVFLNLARSNGVSFQHRAQAQQLTESENVAFWPVPDGRVQRALGRPMRTWTNSAAEPAIRAPCWLSLVRRGDVFSGYVSADGTNWHWVGTEAVRMKSQVHVGLGLGGLRGNRTIPARFDQVSFRSQLPPAAAATAGTGRGLRVTFPEDASRSVLYPTIDFDWGMQKAHLTGATCEGYLEAPRTEPYALEVLHDGAMRLWLNEQLIVDDWSLGPARKARVVLPLEAGVKYPIRLEYGAGAGHKHLKLMWSSSLDSLAGGSQFQLYGAMHPAITSPETQVQPSGDRLLSATNALTLEALQQSDRVPGLALPWLGRVIGMQTNAVGVDLNGGAFRMAGLSKLGRRGADRCPYLYQPWQGDVEIVARLNSAYNGTEWSKAGLMIRENLKDDGLTVVLANTPQGEARVLCRAERGGLLDNTGPAGPRQPWLKLVRRGEVVTGYNSPDGQSWTWLGNVRLGLGEHVFVGLTTGTGGSLGGVPDAVFESVRVAAPEALVPVVGTGDGLRGTYYDLQTSNLVSRVDSQVNFAWGGFVPVKSFGRSGFTVRWESLVEAPYSEPYVIYVKQRGAMQLWLDGKPVLTDTWEEYARERKVQLTMQAGHRYAIRLDYSVKTNRNPTAQLLWSSPNTAKEPIPQSQLYSPAHPAFADIPDKDHDGMPDDWEVANGLNPFDASDASLDPDQDGLTNLEEYRAGTNPHNSDTDHDGLPEGWEVRHGLNPCDPADAIKDSDHDGLSNLEEYLAGTDPQNPDTDEDGLYDEIELKETGTNPRLSDIQNIVTVFESPGTGTVSRVGRWIEAGQSLHALDHRGCVEYVLTAPQADMYRVEIAGASPNTNDLNREFELLIWVDGEYLGRSVLVAGNESHGVVHQLMPWLTGGDHRVRIYWDNAVWNRSFALTAVRLQQLQGPDTDGDGVKNWAEKRLKALCGVDAGQRVSAVSPACIEGYGGYLSMMNISGGLTPQHGPGNRWYANVPLSPTTTNTVICSFQNDGLRTTNWIVWQPTDLLAAADLTVRIGDALLLTASASTNKGQVQIQVPGVTNYVTTPKRPVVHQFNQAGVFAVSGTYQPQNGGAAQSRTITVRVIAASFDTTPAAWTAKWRPWTFTNLPPGATLESAAPVGLQEAPLQTNSRSFLLTMDQPETHYVVARLATNGPVVANRAVEGFRLYSAQETIVQRLTTYEDGSDLVEMRLVLSPLRTNVTVNIRIIAGGVIFEDGTVEQNLTATDFNDLGQAKVRFIRPASARTSVCHQTRAYQDSVLLGVFH